MARSFAATAVVRPVAAEPLLTKLTTVRSDSTTVVIGTVTSVVAGKALVRVDTTLRGPTTTSVSLTAPTVSHQPLIGQRIVAFGDATNELRWYGKLVGGTDIEHGVLLLSGFYDFNAHGVVPGLMTLAQLRNYLTSGTLPTRTFVGSIGFPDGHGHILPSSKRFTTRVEPTGTPHVSGFSIACQSFSSLWGLDWGTFELTFSDTCLKPGQQARELRLRGAPTGVDAMGNITVLVSPASPVMQEKEYDRFVADGTITDVKRVVRLLGSDGSRWTWNVEGSLSDGSSTRELTVGHGSSITPPSAGSVHEDTWSFADVMLKLTQRGEQARSLGTMLDLFQALDAGIGTWTIEKKGLAPIRVTAVQDPPSFVRR